MPEDLLSADELDALLAEADDTASSKKPREKRITPYDFVRPNKLSGDQVRALQRLHENIAQNLTMVLSTYLRLNIEVTLISLGQLSFDVFRGALPNPTLVNVLSIDPIQEKALLTVDCKLAFSLIDRMLGGPGKSLEKIRVLTHIEQSIIDNIVQRFLERIKDGWEALLEFTPKVDSREMDPQFVQVVPSSEMVLIATFNIAAPGELETGEICFCIPFLSLDTVIAKLGTNFQFAAVERTQTPIQRGHIERVLGESTLPVNATLGTMELSVGQILALKEGDVLILDQRTDLPIECGVGTIAKLLARPGKSGRRTAIFVEAVHPQGMAELKPKPHLLPKHLQALAAMKQTQSETPAPEGGSNA